jgi:thiol:disulfide interchange protein DsbD
VRAWLPGYALVQKSSDHLLIALALVALGLALGAVHVSFGEGGARRVRKGLGIAASCLGILMLVGYLEARPAQQHAGWEHDLASAREKARSEKAPLMVDFGASWCQACGELDRHTFSDPRVIGEAGRFVKVKVDLSPGKDTASGKEWLKSYGARGLPLVVLHTSDGRESVRVTEFVDADKMLSLLKAVN